MKSGSAVSLNHEPSLCVNSCIRRLLAFPGQTLDQITVITGNYRKNPSKIYSLRQMTGWMNEITYALLANP